jgi:hypothetical protein
MEKYTIKHFIPKKSNVGGKVPTTASTVEGELSVNTADDKIFLHNSGNQEITFSSDAYNDERFVNASGDTVDGKLGIADTLSVSGNAIFSSGITMPYMGENVVLQDLISGNSYVTSQALNDLNQRMFEYLPLSGGTMTNGIKYSQDETYKRVYNADGSTNYIGTYASFLQPNNLFRNIVTRNEWINVYSGDDITLYRPVIYQADSRQWSYAPPIGSYIGGSYTLSFSIPNDGLSYDPSMIFEIYGGASETIVEIGKDAEYYMNNYASSLQLQCSGDITTAKTYVKEKDKQKGVLYKSHHSDNRYTVTFDENPSDTHVLIFRWKAKNLYTPGGLDSPIFVQGDIDVKASDNMSLLLEGEITRKQDKLVSGTNIKTINGVSLLGDGNIDVSGGTGISVTSVNGKTGVVTLTADDLNAAQLDEQNIFTQSNIFVDETELQGATYFRDNAYVHNTDENESTVLRSKGLEIENGTLLVSLEPSGLTLNNDASVGTQLTSQGIKIYTKNESLKGTDFYFLANKGFHMSSSLADYLDLNYSGLTLSDGISQGNTIHVKNSGLSSNTDASDTIVWNTNGGKTNLSAYTLQSVYSKFSANVGEEILTLENEISEKQDELVSGVNIKTINNQSLLGQGNIDISGGASITVDSELSTSSTNPVQNKVITANVPTLNGKNTFTGSNTLTDGQHLSVVNDCSSITIDDGNSNWITLTAEGIKLDDDDDTGLVTTLGQSGLTISGETSSVGIDSTLTESKIAFNDYSKTGGYETDSYLSSSELYIENHTEQYSKLTPDNLELCDSIERQKTNLGYSGLTLFDNITDNEKKIVITDKVSTIDDGKNTVVIENSGIYLPSGTSAFHTYFTANKLEIENGYTYVSLDAENLNWGSNGIIGVSNNLYFKQGNNTYKFDFDKAVSLGLLVKQS